jgi:D-glycero-alpha-D-manno-heptose-7-phosphate kinase
VDLAGGTLDIWPLYLLLKNPVTVNLAIDLRAEAWIEEKDAKGTDTGVEFVSRDQGSVVSVSWKEFDEQEELPPWVALPWRLLRHFIKKKQGLDRANTRLRLETLSRSPAGAGLGGSSGLNISATGALAAWADVDP